MVLTGNGKQSSRNVKKLTGHLVLQAKNFAGPDKTLQDQKYFFSKSKELYSLKNWKKNIRYETLKENK